jgi:hypothetical protein
MAGKRMAWAAPCVVALSCGATACPTMAGDLTASGLGGMPLPSPSLPPPPPLSVVVPPPVITPPSLPAPPRVSAPMPAPTSVSAPQPTSSASVVPPAASVTPAGSQARTAAAPAPAQTVTGAATSGGESSQSAPRGSAARNAPPAVRRRRAAQHTRRLRRFVFRHATCLPTLPAIERAVLAIRAGVGERRGHSVRYVAQRLNTSQRRVRRFERRGVRHLRNRGTCAGRESRPAVLTGDATVSSDTTYVSGEGGSTAPDEDRSGSGHGVKSARTRGVKHAPLPPVASEPPPPKPPDQGFLLLLGLLALVAVATVVRKRRRRRGSN